MQSARRANAVRTVKHAGELLRVETPAGLVAVMCDDAGEVVHVAFSGATGWTLRVGQPRVNNSSGQQGASITARGGEKVLATE